ncbi:uncharacterized protein F5147DRAFT_667349 [Suillus discolor]|uniref:DUF6533 domain-containing protein n=1 Tax=Suillus discolor TaxID=1912936 RepID=A0A9P7FJM4_9AGAM|nr:uncharacterized protein F5147DRAFT_667349 [Suillus discolor]KAG2118901.1 hypothetical protein F5147DRAFT_667349 [Suillus discolor]
MYVYIYGTSRRASLVHKTCLLPLESIMMESEYSADTFAASGSLRTSTYIYTSMATFWTYSYACSLHEEWTFLLQSRWTKIKCLYIIARYVPFLLFAGHLYMNFIPDEDPKKCHMIDNICSCFSIISITCSESIFVLRTYVLWNKNRFMLAAMLAAFLAAGAASTGLFFAFLHAVPFETSPIPGITGCYQPSDSIGFYVPFILSSVLQLGLISVTLIRALQTWQVSNNYLLAVLLKHNIFYYICGFSCSMVNVLASVFLQDAYKAMFQDFQFIILGILATHMHLHLWHKDQHQHSSMLTPMSEMSYVGRSTA